MFLVNELNKIQGECIVDGRINVSYLQRLHKIREDLDTIINKFPQGHCRQCGDLSPKSGFYPLITLTCNSKNTSGYICNDCENNNKK